MFNLFKRLCSGGGGKSKKCVRKFFKRILSIIFVLLEKHHLSLHDYISGTYVMDTLITHIDNDENNDETIIEVQVEEVIK